MYDTIFFEFSGRGLIEGWSVGKICVYLSSEYNHFISRI